MLYIVWCNVYVWWHTVYHMSRCVVVGSLIGFLLSHTCTVSFMAWSPDCVHLVHLGLSQSYLSRCTLASGTCTIL